MPHVTDIVQNWIKSVAEIPVDASQIPPDVCLIEVGGTVGDIESMVISAVIFCPSNSNLACPGIFGSVETIPI